jgi:hypothetical protein
LNFAMLTKYVCEEHPLTKIAKLNFVKLQVARYAVTILYLMSCTLFSIW